jgi:hypothetical protein
MLKESRGMPSSTQRAMTSAMRPSRALDNLSSGAQRLFPFPDRFHSSSSRSPGLDFDTGENNASQTSIPTLSIPLPSFDL